MSNSKDNTLSAVPFSPGWLSDHVFVVKPDCDPDIAIGHASSVLGYVRDRLSAAVQGDAGDDDDSISGSEACLLAFAVSSAKAVLDALPVPGKERSHD